MSQVIPLKIKKNDNELIQLIKNHKWSQISFLMKNDFSQNLINDKPFWVHVMEEYSLINKENQMPEELLVDLKDLSLYENNYLEKHRPLNIAMLNGQVDWASKLIKSNFELEKQSYIYFLFGMKRRHPMEFINIKPFNKDEMIEWHVFKDSSSNKEQQNYIKFLKKNNINFDSKSWEHFAIHSLIHRANYFINYIISENLINFENNFKDENKNLLFLALETKNYSIADKIFEKSKNFLFKMPDKKYKSVLDVAVLTHCLETIDFVVNKLNKETLNDLLPSAMVYAIEANNVEIMKKLYSYGIDLNANFEGMSFLHYACFEGHEQAVNWLVNRGLDLNLIDDCGYSCLDFLQKSNKKLANDITEGKLKRDNVITVKFR